MRSLYIDSKSPHPMDEAGTFNKVDNSLMLMGGFYCRQNKQVRRGGRKFLVTKLWAEASEKQKRDILVGLSRVRAPPSAPRPDTGP
ncbi:hypothetical protein PoB_003625200 [Plakobranchus ocellatus]|uniref:Uncharacterized protein n=1 Tax=Plakobranchus ocellatus TaxID=259542 RepID=A0AAV4AS20_9GAST|nr:hypothetical protein PoB_003625200 [Plakobranchus ocellatus]